MSLLQSYLLERRRRTIRMWIGYSAANVACLLMLLLMLYV